MLTKLLEGKKIDDEHIGLELHEQGFFKYMIFDYKESIKIFEEKLSQPLSTSDKGITYANLSMLYILDGDISKAKECIANGFKNNEYRFSNKNLGYCHLIEGNKSAALATFNTAIRTFGFGNFMFQLNQEYEHMLSVIDEDVLKEIVQDLKSKMN